MVQTRKNVMSDKTYSGRFWIKKEGLSEAQILAIRNHGFNWTIDHNHNAWNITDMKLELFGYTAYSNFPIKKFFKAIGVRVSFMELKYYDR
jgi:hypothetical protein